MRLTCPACGAQASAEAWANDAEARRAFGIISTLPRGVARLALPYLALFRPNERGLGWARACKLLEQLKSLIEAPEICWEREHLSNNPDYWEAALDKLTNRPPSELPLKNHNYLRVIAWQTALQANKWHPSEHRAQSTGHRAQGTEHGAQGGTEDLLAPEDALKAIKEITQNLAKKMGG